MDGLDVQSGLPAITLRGLTVVASRVLDRLRIRWHVWPQGRRADHHRDRREPTGVRELVMGSATRSAGPQFPTRQIISGDNSHRSRCHGIRSVVSHIVQGSSRRFG